MNEEGKKAYIFAQTLFSYLSMPDKDFVMLSDLMELLRTTILALCEGTHDSLIVVDLAELISK